MPDDRELIDGRENQSTRERKRNRHSRKVRQMLETGRRKDQKTDDKKTENSKIVEENIKRVIYRKMTKKEKQVRSQ